MDETDMDKGDSPARGIRFMLQCGKKFFFKVMTQFTEIWEKFQIDNPSSYYLILSLTLTSIYEGAKVYVQIPFQWSVVQLHN